MPNQLFDQKFYSKDVNQQRSELSGVAVTPADGSDLPNGVCEAIFVTAGGNVNVNLASGGTAVLTGLSAGQIVYCRASRILATSTTATGIFALYVASNL